MTLSRRNTIIIALALIIGTALIELAMGREPICKCGVVRFWGVANSPENSQQIADWYTPSHIVHGLLFYAATGLIPGLHLRWRLLLAIFVEVAWEIAENSSWIIDRYREATIALDYYGDSVLNSVSDVLAMLIGFWLASRLPVWASVLTVIALELLALAVIRDNLTLNILMLLHPLESVRQWQAGA